MKFICAQCLYEGLDRYASIDDFPQIAVVDGDSLCKPHAEQALKTRRETPESSWMPEPEHQGSE